MTPIVADTSPYPWPYDQRIDAHTLALLICGAGPHWAGRTPNDPKAEAAIEALRLACQAQSVPTIAISHDKPDQRPVAVTHWSEADPLAQASDTRISAAGLDGFYGSNLDPYLRRAGRTHLLVVGRGFEGPVHSTLRRANDQGYECLIVADACIAIDPANHAASISTIEMSGGIFGAVGTTAAVLDALNPTVHEDPTEKDLP
jgi:nicotinamidase-related amidase